MKSSLQPWLLAALGLASLAGYRTAVVGLTGYGQAEDVLAFLGLFGGLFVLYFVALWAVRRPGAAGRSGGLRHILAWAFLFRLALLPAGLPRSSWLADLEADLTSQAVTYRTFLLYDNDVWRYLWDGHVASAGLGPYAHTPAELEAMAEAGDAAAAALFAEALWYDVFDNVSFQLYRTVYPPAAQLLFRLLHALAPASVAALKLVLALVDFGTCLLLAALLRRLGRRPAAVVVYAWNPLVVKEIAGSGHVDALMIFFLTLAVYCMARGWRRASLVAYGVSILSKLAPVLLVGLFLRRTRPRDWPLLVLVLAVGYLPFVASWPQIAEGIRVFSREWVFNPGPWALWKWLAEQADLPGRGTAGLLSLLLTLGIVGWVLLKDDGTHEGLAAGSFVILGGFLVLSSTVMPWYLLWVLPFAALRTGLAWPAFTGLSLLSYLIYIDQIEHPWVLWTEYLAFFLLLAWESRRREGAEATAGRSP